MNHISVVINTFNAERHLERVLRSVKDFDEILVCDMHSTDRTIAIAREYGCTIVYHDHTGFVEPARNFAIQSARHPWVLVIDAVQLVTYQYGYYSMKDWLKAGVTISFIWIPLCVASVLFIGGGVLGLY